MGEDGLGLYSGRQKRRPTNLATCPLDLWMPPLKNNTLPSKVPSGLRRHGEDVLWDSMEKATQHGGAWVSKMAE